MQRITKAVELDDLQPVDDMVMHSSSAVDIRTVLLQGPFTLPLDLGKVYFLDKKGLFCVKGDILYSRFESMLVSNLFRKAPLCSYAES